MTHLHPRQRKINLVFETAIYVLSFFSAESLLSSLVLDYGDCEYLTSSINAEIEVITSWSRITGNIIRVGVSYPHGNVQFIPWVAFSFAKRRTIGRHLFLAAKAKRDDDLAEKKQKHMAAASIAATAKLDAKNIDPRI